VIKINTERRDRRVFQEKRKNNRLITLGGGKVNTGLSCTSSRGKKCEDRLKNGSGGGHEECFNGEGGVRGVRALTD